MFANDSCDMAKLGKRKNKRARSRNTLTAQGRKSIFAMCRQRRASSSHLES